MADRVTMVFPGAPRASADEVAHSLLTLWLRQSGAGTLSHALIDDQLLAEWVDAELMRGALSSELRVTVQARAGVELERVEQAIDAYIARVPMLLEAATVSRLGRRKLAELLFLQEDVLERAQHHTAQLRERGSPSA